MAVNKDFLMGYGAGKAAGGGGGGNPNSIEVINATLANPWGSSTKYLEYYDKYEDNHGADAVLLADATAIGFMVIRNPIDRSFFEGCEVDASHDSSLGYYIDFDMATGDITGGFVVQNGDITDLIAYASLIPTTLTIYWHPMPES